MNIDRIRSFYYMRPARPFTIHTASGEKYTVKHPETMAIDDVEEVVVLLPGPGRLAMIDMANITEITQDFTKQETSAEA
jgi:hypothetical protein